MKNKKSDRLVWWEEPRLDGGRGIDGYVNNWGRQEKKQKKSGQKKETKRTGK